MKGMPLLVSSGYSHTGPKVPTFSKVRPIWTEGLVAGDELVVEGFKPNDTTAYFLATLSPEQTNLKVDFTDYPYARARRITGKGIVHVWFGDL